MKPARPLLRWLLLPMFLSGAAALMVELCWLRSLTVMLGGSSTALDIVLVTFMLGLAFGARLAPAVARRWDSLRAYAVLEALLSAYVLASPFVLAALESGLLRFLPRVGHETVAEQVLRFLASGAALLLPTLAMGITTPLLISALARRERETAERAAWLYAANTLGGAVGAFVAGALLILQLGIRGTLRVAACSNLAAALLATAFVWLAGRHGGAADAGEPQQAAVPASSRAYLALAAASGFLGMALEVGIARLLLFTIGGSHYSHTMILTGFLLGIVLGSGLAALIARRRPPEAGDLAPLLLFASFATTGSVLLFEELPMFLQGQLVGRLGAELPPLAIKLVAVLCLIALPAAASGLILPWLVHLQRRVSGDAGSAARIFFLNTLGGAAGAGAAGYLLIGPLGVRGAVLCLAGLALALGVWALLGNEPLARPMTPPLLAAAAGGLLAFAALTRGHRPLVVSSVNYALLGRPEVLYYDEDRTASVSVVRLAPEGRGLFINGLVSVELRSPVEVTEAADIALPSHPAARQVFVAGLGTGLSTGVAALYPQARVRVVEISRAVARALPFFDGLTYGLSTNPRVGVVAGDARHYLATTRESYDIILPDVYLSALTGAAYLYNVEFFRLCSARLAPGGRAAIISSLYDEIDKVIAAGFVETFDHVHAVRSPHDAMWILLGANEAFELPTDPLLGEGVPELEQRLSSLGLAGRSLASLESLSREQLLNLFHGTRPSTDDLPVVDYLGSLDPTLALSW